ncbi:DUF1223 domain-containing protein [Litoribrevibacter albus]|uniref:DUF1223 domain-containing protein n=1 Tax=Litoribrevibacter albus TaxID=1473156 RepID=A0AA37S9X8_9GAMM|nr:DUF1223 domain-containing protein [Litoribrevibacter albus]GLQ30844.1 hypothetical protein GCM10007876_13230 [Litoribrevibacter albus]
MRISALPLLLTLSWFANGQTLVSPNHQTVMLELYTSQGCSSCPPAEKWISGFTDDPKLWKELIPINFRVDYWDYLGWRDRYSNPLFSERQRRYQRLGHSRTVATPGFILNGKGWNGWFYRKSMTAESLSNAGVLTVDIPDDLSSNKTAQSKRTNIQFEHKQEKLQALTAHLVIMGFGLEDYIKRGENRGKTFVQDFVALAYDSAPLISQADRSVTNIAFPDMTTLVQAHPATQYAVAVWVSKENDPSPIQAVGDWIEMGPDTHQE